MTDHRFPELDGGGTAQIGCDVEALTANAVRAGIYHLDGAQVSP